MTSFFCSHINLGIGKYHILRNKILRTLGDALMRAEGKTTYMRSKLSLSDIVQATKGYYI